jgi:hypothetical protein
LFNLVISGANAGLALANEVCDMELLICSRGGEHGVKLVSDNGRRKALRHEVSDLADDWVNGFVSSGLEIISYVGISIGQHSGE